MGFEGGRLVEVEPYVEHDAKMDSWERLEAGLPLLGRIHTLLRSLEVSEDGRNAPAANHIEPRDVLTAVRRGIDRIRAWDPTPAELQLAAASEELARLVDRAERDVEGLPRQLVHGDYWDNNVLFHAGRVVLVAGLDFMGERRGSTTWRSRSTTRTPRSRTIQCRTSASAGCARSSMPTTVAWTSRFRARSVPRFPWFWPGRRCASSL